MLSGQDESESEKTGSGSASLDLTFNGNVAQHLQVFFGEVGDRPTPGEEPMLVLKTFRGSSHFYTAKPTPIDIVGNVQQVTVNSTPGYLILVYR